MKMTPFVALLSVAAVSLLLRLDAQEKPAAARFEYATIHWAGKENTHIILPSSEVVFIGAEFKKLRRPERVDERSFYMNAAINGLTKDGFELASATPDEIVMRRLAGH